MTDNETEARANRDGAPISAVQWIDRNKIKPNSYNPNSVAPAEMELLRTSIEADGYTQPIVVHRESMEIVDGFHRWTVGGDLLISARYGGKVPVVFVDSDKAGRIASTVRHNRARGSHAVLKMSDLVGKMRQEGKNDEAIKNDLGMDDDEIKRLDQRAVDGWADDELGEAWLFVVASKTDKETQEGAKAHSMLFTHKELNGNA